MIGKAPGTGSGFKGAFRYLLEGPKDRKDPSRVAWLETRNLLVDDPALAPALMRATAAQSVRCKKPVYHLVISWKPEENPSDDLIRLVGDTTLGDLGLTDHQALFFVHTDTANKHLHILVNRVNPETGKAWSTSKDWARIERSVGRQAKEHGMIFVEGRHNTPAKQPVMRQRAKDGEVQQARRTGVVIPPGRWSQEEIVSRRSQVKPIFAQARTWDDLTHLLAAEQLKVLPKGQGLVLSDAHGHMKLSDLGKEIRLKDLEAFYGERYEAFTQRPLRELSPDLGPVTAPAVAQPAVTQAITSSQTAKSSQARTPLQPTLTTKQVAPADTDTDADAANVRVAPEEEPEPVETIEPEPEPSAKGSGPLQPTVNRPVVPPAGDNDDESVPAAPLSPPVRTEQPADPRSEAFASLAAANAAVDLARRLHKAGLVTKQQLFEARKAAERARDEVNKYQTFAEFIADGVRDALTPKQDVPQTAKKPEKPARNQRKEADRDDDDRER
jgi:hypothetical protein